MTMSVVFASLLSFCLFPQSVLPFFVATKMTKIRKPTLDKPTPDRYVAAEVNTVGLEDQTNGYFPHAVMVHPLLQVSKQIYFLDFFLKAFICYLHDLLT